MTPNNPASWQIWSTLIFILAILHTFVCPMLAGWSHHLKKNSWQATLMHYLAEVEVVFLLWSAVMLVGFLYWLGPAETLAFVDNVNFTEPAFVFVITFMAATKPVIQLAEVLLIELAKLLFFLPKQMAFYFVLLTCAPLLGSLITEPAAMTVASLILLQKFFAPAGAQSGMSTRFKYATIGLLFVNISIGGALTHFAAPPIVMVAHKWGWNSGFVFTQFGFKAMIAILCSTISYIFLFRAELTGRTTLTVAGLPKWNQVWWLYLLHIGFLVLLVLTSHHMKFFLGLLLFFLGFLQLTAKHQSENNFRQAFMVGVFLAGLVVIGAPQAWWLGPVLNSLSDLALYFTATGLTAITDNAALTYLGSLVELSDPAKYSLVAGAITGGGLTVIANAPNPIGYSILREAFPRKQVAPLSLFLWALYPTLVTILCFELIP